MVELVPFCEDALHLKEPKLVCAGCVKEMKRYLKKKVQEAMMVMGRPTMHYAHDVAVQEYSRNIFEASEILLGVLERLSKDLEPTV